MSKIKYNYLTNKTDYRYIDYWFIRKIISNDEPIIAEGTEFSVDSPRERKFKLISFKGNTVQEGTPTPLLPQFVNIVTGLQTISITNSSSVLQQYNLNLGKNLFDKDHAHTLSGYVGTANVILGPGSVENMCYIECEPNTTYTVQKENTGTNNRFGLFTTDVVPTLGVHVLNTAGTHGAADDSRVYSITTPSNAKYLGVFFAQPGGQSTPSVTEIMATIQIEKGSTATTYAPYFTPIELCKLGNYQDYIYKDGETWKIHKEIGKYIFTDSETGSYQSSFPRFSVNFQHGQNYTTSVAPLALCSHLKVGQTANTNFTFGISTNVIFIHNESCTSFDELNQWFKENNITIYFVLNTPTDTEITNTALVEQLNNVLNNGKFSKGTNTVKITSNDLPGIIHIEA